IVEHAGSHGNHEEGIARRFAEGRSEHARVAALRHRATALSCFSTLSALFFCSAALISSRGMLTVKSGMQSASFPYEGSLRQGNMSNWQHNLVRIVAVAVITALHYWH